MRFPLPAPGIGTGTLPLEPSWSEDSPHALPRNLASRCRSLPLRRHERPKAGSATDRSDAIRGLIMGPFLVLVAFPVLIGIAAELIFRDARRATLAAGLGAATLTCVSVQVLDSDAAWTWLAALLVSPLPIAFAVATALFWYGHMEARSRRGKRQP